MPIETSTARTPEQLDAEVRKLLAGRTRRSFLIGGTAALLGAGAYQWLYKANQINQLQHPLRTTEEFNRALNDGLFQQASLAPTYPSSAITGLRINGDYGIDPHLIQTSWGLQLIGLDRPQQYRQYMPDVDLWEYKTSDNTGADPTPAPTQPNPKSKGLNLSAAAPATLPHMEETTGATTAAGATPGVVLSLADLKKMPYTEQITQFKCIEGWSQILRWGGVKFSDVLKAYPPANIGGAAPKYVTMETSDGQYNASFDMQSLLHPQTLLCYSMGGQPLESAHGAPLRLVMPLKYGYKQIKAIASITYSNTRTPDYWEKLGYDWYAGL